MQASVAVQNLLNARVMLATKVFYARRKTEVCGRTSLPASATSTIAFKARVLLDSTVFEARAMLATEVKVVIISSSMLELCSEPRSSKLELECYSTPRSSRLERCSPPRSRSSLSRHQCSSCARVPRLQQGHVLICLCRVTKHCVCFLSPPSHLLTFSLVP